MFRFLPHRVYIPIVAAASLAGCAGLQSQRVAETDVVGIAYYMPMKYFALSVTKEGGKVTKLEWTESAAFPDLSQTYRLRFNPHWIGKTTVQIEVGSSGLLGVANTNTTDSAAELATIKAAAAFKVNAAKLDPTDKCAPDGVFLFLFPGPGSGDVCGVIAYKIAAVPPGKTSSKEDRAASPKSVNTDSRTDGVFYRVNRPYIATAQEPGGQQVSNLLFVPNESTTMLLPYGRTLFAANDGKVEFTDGVLHKYDQADEGELVALLKFPASIIGAYFTAVGNVFAAFSAKNAKDADLQLKELQINILKFKIEKCTEALDKGDKAALDSLQCGSLSSS
jgi:hypothetical protein